MLKKIYTGLLNEKLKYYSKIFSKKPNLALEKDDHTLIQLLIEIIIREKKTT